MGSAEDNYCVPKEDGSKLLERVRHQQLRLAPHLRVAHLAPNRLHMSPFPATRRQRRSSFPAANRLRRSPFPSAHRQRREKPVS
jgi:hypothetical protein